MRYPTLQQRPFEAQSVPCGRCGSPLPVDPLALSVFCPFCQAVTPIPAELRLGAGTYQRELQRAYAERAGGVADVERLSAEARAQKVRSIAYIIVAAVCVVPGILSVIGTVGVWAVLLLLGIINAVLEPFFDESVLLIVDVGVIAALALGLLLLLVGSVLLWRWLKHRRRVRRAGQGGNVAGTAYSSCRTSSADRAGGVGAAVCAVCGGPVSFQIGQQQVACTYCGSTVVPGPAQKRGLVALAFEEARLAADLERYRAERERLRASKGASRTYVAYMALVMGGVCVIPLAIVLAVIVIVFRKITRGVEDAIDDFAVSVGGDMERGLELPFDWLDTYWAGRAPDDAQYLGGPFDIRWSAYGAYAGRPVLVTTTSNWRDAVAKRIAILLAHPATRSRASVEQALASPAAQEARAMGFWPDVGDAGVSLQRPEAPAEQLSVHNLHRLVTCAYGMSGITG